MGDGFLEAGCFSEPTLLSLLMELIELMLILELLFYEGALLPWLTGLLRIS
jgi:hypothetical protein